jgi:quercetin dioxygenase-like cupin family protein
VITGDVVRAGAGQGRPGELTGYCGDDHWTATAGSFVFVPRDQVHGFTVTGDTTARAVVITGPPRLDRQIAARGTGVTD